MANKNARSGPILIRRLNGICLQCRGLRSAEVATRSKLLTYAKMRIRAATRISQCYPFLFVYFPQRLDGEIDIRKGLNVSEMRFSSIIIRLIIYFIQNVLYRG